MTSSDDETNKGNPSKAFTPLQSRKLPLEPSADPLGRVSGGKIQDEPLTMAAICPTMDLLAFARCTQMSTSAVSPDEEDSYAHRDSPSNSLYVYRVISWQKLLEVCSADLGSGSVSAISALCWSPDGRVCVVGCASVSPAPTSTCVHLLDIENDGKVVHTLDLSGQSAIAGLAWAKRVVHPSYATSSFDPASEAWRLCKRYYLDRIEHFLPVEMEEVKVKNEALLMNPMNVFQQKNLDTTKKDNPKSRDTLHTSSTRNGTSSLPSCASTLSILYVLSSSGDLFLYLFGRCLIATIKNGSNPGARARYLKIACSSDLSSVLTYVPGMTLYLYDFPVFIKRYNELCWISSSFSFIENQLKIISSTLPSLTKIWKDSIRLLDMKFTLLRNLFKDYDIGTDASPRSELLNMILIGNSKTNASSDAIKLFFSNYMAEQGLQRIINTSISGVTAIETSIRSNVLRAAHALLYSASELLGLSKAAKAWNDTIPLFSVKHALEFHQYAELFCIITEQLLLDITTFHYRLNDLLRWFVGISAMIKAEGTAEDFIGQENARRKKPSQACMNHITAFLSDSSYNKDTSNGILETEQVVGIGILKYFNGGTVLFKRPGDSKPQQTPSLVSSHQKLAESLAKLSRQPMDTISRTVGRTEIVFDDNEFLPQSQHALHHRMGKENSNVKGGFQPVLETDARYSSFVSNQWLLIARTVLAEDQQLINIVAFPGLSHDEDRDEIYRPSYYLSAFIEVPQAYNVLELKFYGDDGNSSLLSFSQSANKEEDKVDKEEGKQALTAVVNKRTGFNTNDESSALQELWYFEYDSLDFRKIKVPDEYADTRKLRVASKTNEDKVSEISFEDIDNDTTANSKLALFVRRRLINSQVGNLHHQKTLIVGGTRGIGGCLTDGNKIDLFDMEEDEDLDESGADDSEEFESEED